MFFKIELYLSSSQEDAFRFEMKKTFNYVYLKWNVCALKSQRYSTAHRLYKGDTSNRTQDLEVYTSYLYTCHADQWAVRRLASQVDLIETQ